MEKATLRSGFRVTIRKNAEHSNSKRKDISAAERADDYGQALAFAQELFEEELTSEA
jgi:hypothetical protein